MINTLDRIGSAGAVIAAIAAPCCFPLFAAVTAGIGLGALGRFEAVVLYIFQGFALLAVVGLALGFRAHRNLGPFALGLLSLVALGYSFYASWHVELLYAALLGILIGSLWNWLAARAMANAKPQLQSVIACPACGHRAEETMPTNACVFFYDCSACNAQLKPKPGDCCVFCSYGSVPCPPIQVGDRCCA